MAEEAHFSVSLRGNHRIREQAGLEGTTVGQVPQPSYSSRVTQSTGLCLDVLNIPTEGDSTTSQGNHHKMVSEEK